MAKLTLQTLDGGESRPLEFQLEGDAFSVILDETVYEGTLVVTGPGEGWINVQSRILPFYMAQKQDMLHLWLDGRTYQFQLFTASTRAGGAAAAMTGEVKAPMPGTVLKIPVQEGQIVEANQALVIMESMKMEMTLSAPGPATVTSVRCAEGQLVEMGAILVTLDAVES